MTTIDFHLPCVHCNADLTGVDLLAACPHCGRPVASTIRVDAIDCASRTIWTDIPCLSCDYNLRTLPIDSICPECAAPVIDSLRADILALADPRWLRNVSRGVNYLFYALIGYPICCLFTVFGAALTPMGGGTAIIILTMIASFLFILLFIFGMIRVAARDPAPQNVACSPWPRRIALIFPVGVVPAFILLLAAGATGQTVGTVTSIAFVFTLGITLSFPASTAALALILRRVAVRARNARLAKNDTSLAWMLGIVAVLFAARLVCDAISDMGSGMISNLLSGLDIAGAIAMVVLLVCSYILALVALYRHRRLFNDARAAGRARARANEEARAAAMSAPAGAPGGHS
jgi:hypothetical protein